MDETTTKADRDAYLAEARAAYPHLRPLQAVLAFALDEAREALQRCDRADLEARKVAYGNRANRDRKD